MKDIYIGTAHPQGGNMIAGKDSKFSSQRVVTEDFKVDGMDNVFVADASLFPTSITINPQWTIMAMSSLAIKMCAKIFPIKTIEKVNCIKIEKYAYTQFQIHCPDAVETSCAW